MLRRRQRGQSIVEFGIIAILFTLIMFAIADFGLLLNDWLSVSSGARQLTRDVSVGAFTCSTPAQCSLAGVQAELQQEAAKLAVPGVSADPYFGGSYCCTPGTPGSALQFTVVYWNECTPATPGCSPVTSATQLDSRYATWTGSSWLQGLCTSWQLATPTPCTHPAAPGPQGSCAAATPPNPPYCPGDSVTVTLTAAGAQVITPLVRPFFQNPTTCVSTSAHCYVALSSTVTMRFEGGAAP